MCAADIQHQLAVNVDPHVIVLRDVIETALAIGRRRSLLHAILAEPRIDPATRKRTAPVVLLDEQFCRISTVDPLRNIFYSEVLTFTG